MVSATTINHGVISECRPTAECAGLRTIGEVLAEMLPRYDGAFAEARLPAGVPPLTANRVRPQQPASSDSASMPRGSGVDVVNTNCPGASGLATSTPDPFACQHPASHSRAATIPA